MQDLRNRRDAAYREYMQLQMQVEQAECLQNTKYQHQPGRLPTEIQDAPLNPYPVRNLFSPRLRLSRAEPTRDEAMRVLTRMSA